MGVSNSPENGILCTYVLIEYQFGRYGSHYGFQNGCCFWSGHQFSQKRMIKKLDYFTNATLVFNELLEFY